MATAATLRDGQTQPMRKLFDPCSIAIVGASSERRRVGGIALDHLVEFGFEGPVYPVNPRLSEIAGLRCYPNVESLPQVPDLAVLAVGSDSVLATLRQCHAKGIGAAIVYASGFAEEGGAGVELQDEIVRFAALSGMVISGPNCMGHANLSSRAITAFATLFKDYPPSAPGQARHGGLASVVTQSGNLCAMLYALGCERGVQFKHVMNTGNEACLEFSQYLAYLADDAETHTVIGYIEGLRDGARFIEVAQRMRTLGKALIVIKVGDSARGAQAALSHTAALSGNQAAYRTAFAQLGVMQARDPAHMIDLAYLAGFDGRSAGIRVAVASISGAMGALLTDLLEAQGVQVPALPQTLQDDLKAKVPTIGMVSNPIDLTAQIFNRDGVAAEVMSALAGTDAADVVLLYATGFMLDRIADETIAVARGSGRLIVAIDTGRSVKREALQAAGIAVFTDVARCTAALGTYLRWRAASLQATWRQVGAGKSQPNAEAGTPADLAEMDEHQTKRWLAGHGVPVGAEFVAHSADEAVRRADDVAAPIAMKILSPDIAHKTEAGGVRLHVRGAAAVREAFFDILTAAQRSHPAARIRGVLCQAMQSGVCELIVGVNRDPVFGLMMTVGLGGIHTELFNDVTHRLLPVDAATALVMLQELRSHRLLTGFRGQPAADVDAACAAIAAVSRAALAGGLAFQELEVNPLLLHAAGQGATALDALFVASSESPPSATTKASL